MKKILLTVCFLVTGMISLGAFTDTFESYGPTYPSSSHLVFPYIQGYGNTMDAGNGQIIVDPANANNHLLYIHDDSDGKGAIGRYIPVADYVSQGTIKFDFKFNSALRDQRLYLKLIGDDSLFQLGTGLVISNQMGVNAGQGIYNYYDNKTLATVDYTASNLPRVNMNWQGWNNAEIVFNNAAGTIDVKINGVSTLTGAMRKSSGIGPKYIGLGDEYNITTSKLDVYIDNLAFIPEPATIGLLMLGSLMLRKKR